ncbi:hypothetical protein D3C81_848840 [compost metagenome]
MVEYGVLAARTEIKTVFETVYDTAHDPLQQREEAPVDSCHFAIDANSIRTHHVQAVWMSPVIVLALPVQAGYLLACNHKASCSLDKSVKYIYKSPENTHAHAAIRFLWRLLHAILFWLDDHSFSRVAPSDDLPRPELL